MTVDGLIIEDKVTAVGPPGKLGSIGNNFFGLIEGNLIDTVELFVQLD
jgi:hypothetical protein